ncbi:MAG: polysaccharide biosynthesis/export family protein, partial [Terriglobia bacterium]
MVVASAASAQQDGPRAIGQSDSANLPVQKLGKDDLISIQVYDSPQLTRTVRVLPDGTIRLPLLSKPVHVEGIFPAQVEALIADALKTDGL